MITCGVYAIKNLATGQLYVGSAIKIERRWAAHRSDLAKGVHHSSRLQRSWNKYGGSQFVFAVLEVTVAADAVSREQHWIDALKPAFNMNPKATSALGVKRSEETKAKLRAIKRPYNAARNHSPQMRAAASARAAARNKTPQQRLAVSAAKVGFRFSQSAEAKAKISASKLGKKRPDLKHGPDGRFLSAMDGRSEYVPPE